MKSNKYEKKCNCDNHLMTVTTVGGEITRVDIEPLRNGAGQWIPQSQPEVGKQWAEERKNFKGFRKVR